MISPEENGGKGAEKLWRKDLGASTNAWTTDNFNDTLKIPISNFQAYYEATFTDRVDVVKDTVKTQKDPTILLKEFDFQYSNTDQSRKLKRVCLPFHIAIASGSKKVVEALLELGADIQSRDSFGRNVLHNLSTITAYLRYSKEEYICSAIPWMIEKFGIDVVYDLSRQENQDGLRPVEYAAQQNALRVMQTMLETKGLYICGGITKGDTEFLNLDVTEYETSERHSKSPLNILAYLDEKKMDAPDTADVMLSPVITSWIASKKKADMVPMIIWILFRLMIFTVYLTVDLNVEYLKAVHGENASVYICEDLGHIHLNSHTEIILVIILLIGSFVSITLFMIALVRDKMVGLGVLKYYLYGKKKMAANRFFFEIVEMAYCLCMFVAMGVFFDTLTNGPSDARLLVFDIIRLILPMFIIWLLIYFVQLIPFLGSFIISVQGMVGDMIRFFFLFALIIFPFAHAFETYALSNSQEGCIDDFRNPLQTCYTLFKMMLNMHDLAQHDIKNIAALYVLHVLFVFMIAVLLLNFLIAIMSSSQSQMANHEKLLLTINQISLLNECEISSFWARAWFYPMLNKFAFSKCDNKVLVRFEKCRLGKLRQKVHND